MDARSMFDWKHEFNENSLRLRTNLESIIAKYDRSFDGDDEVDISSMSIVKDRGQIRKCRSKRFGNCKLAAGKARDVTYLLSGCEDSALGSSETANSFASVDTTFQDNTFCSQAVKREPGLGLNVNKPDLTCIQEDILCNPELCNPEPEPSDAETISSTSSESEDDLCSPPDDLDSDTSCSDIGVVSDIDDDNRESTDTTGGVCSGSEVLESDSYSPQYQNNQARKSVCTLKEGPFSSDQKLVDLSAVNKLQRLTTYTLEPSPRLATPNSGMTQLKQTELQELRNSESDSGDSVTLLMDDLTTSSGVDTRPKASVQSRTKTMQCLVNKAAANNLTFVVEHSKDCDSTRRLQCSSSELRLSELESLRVSGTSERSLPLSVGSLSQNEKSKRNQVGRPLVWKLRDTNSGPLVLRPGKTDINQNIPDVEDLNIRSAASFSEDSFTTEQPCNVTMNASGSGDQSNAIAVLKDNLSERSCTPKRKPYMPDVPRYSNEDFLEILSSPGPITGPGTDLSSVEKDISDSFKKLTRDLQLNTTVGTMQLSVPACLSQDTLARLKQRTSVPQQLNRWATSVPARLFTQNLMPAPVSGHRVMFPQTFSPHQEIEVRTTSSLETNTPCLQSPSSQSSDAVQSSAVQEKSEQNLQSPVESRQRQPFARRATSPSVLFAQLKLQSPAQGATERISAAGTQSCVPRVLTKRCLFQNPTNHVPFSADKRDTSSERTPKINRGNTSDPKVNAHCRVTSLPTPKRENVRPVQRSAKQSKHCADRSCSYSPVKAPKINTRSQPPRRVVPTALPATLAPHKVDSDCEMLPPQDLVVKPKIATLPNFYSPTRLNAEALRKHTMQNNIEQTPGVSHTYSRKKGAKCTSTPTKHNPSVFDITSISSIDCCESVPDTVSLSNERLDSSEGSSSSTVLEHMKKTITRSRKVLSDTSSDDLSESSEGEAPSFLSITPKAKLTVSKGFKFSKKERSPKGLQFRSPSHTRAELVQIKERVTSKVLKHRTKWVPTSEEESDDDYIPQVASEPRQRQLGASKQRVHHRRLNLSATARKDSPKRPRESDSDLEFSPHNDTLKHTPKRINTSAQNSWTNTSAQNSWTNTSAQNPRTNTSAQNSMVCLGPGRCRKSFCFNCMTS